MYEKCKLNVYIFSFNTLLFVYIRKLYSGNFLVGFLFVLHNYMNYNFGLIAFQATRKPESSDTLSYYDGQMSE